MIWHPEGNMANLTRLERVVSRFESEGCYQKFKEKNNYSIEYLLSLTIDKTFPDWKDYYNKHMGK